MQLTFSLLAMDAALLPGVDGHLGPVCHLEFAKDVADMPLDGVLLMTSFSAIWL